MTLSTINRGWVVVPIIALTFSLGALFPFDANADQTHTILAATSTYGGSISPIGATIVTDGTDQTYTITPETGLHIADVLVDGHSVGATTTYVFSANAANHTINASFALDSDAYVLSEFSHGNGSISPVGENGFTVVLGGNQTFTITPDAGFKLATLVIDGVPMATSTTTYTFTSISASHSIEAYFNPIGTVLPPPVYYISAGASTGGSIAPAGSTTLAAGGNQTYTITPDAHFNIAEVLIDGTSIGATSTYAFASTSEDHAVFAYFAADSTSTPPMEPACDADQHLDNYECVTNNDGSHDGSHDGHHNGSDNGGHDGDKGNHGGNGGGSTPPPAPTTGTVVATKIVCDSASDLPTWGAGGGSTITASTASNFVAAHSDCHLTSGWSFQWAPNGATNPGDNTGAAGSPWTTFGPTAANGTASVIIPAAADNAATWVREVWESGYVPFTYNTNNKSNTASTSAGMYCNVDHTNYDNYDQIDGAQAGATYYCVGFNALAATTTTNGGDDTASTTTSGGGTATTTDSGSTTTTVAAAASGNGGGGSSFGGGNWGSGCGAGFVWSASALKCIPTGSQGGQVLGASCGIYVDKYLALGNASNDPATVTKVQTFLNTWMGTNLPLTGVYDTATFNAVKAFQNKYDNQVLKPWGEDTAASGLVYLSTVYQINTMQCPALTLPYPTLIPWTQNSNAQ